MVSVGIIEISSIVKGYVACDSILKKTNIEMVMAQPVCPGKFIMIFGGSVSSVTLACEHISKNYAQYILDVQKFGNIDKRVLEGLGGGCSVKTGGALGFVETFTAASCILAADIALKAAEVELGEIRIARGMGGKSYVCLSGTVSAVDAAVNSGAAYAQSEGLLVDKDVIASPHEDMWQYIQ